jgi:hypothetical protein
VSVPAGKECSFGIRADVSYEVELDGKGEDTKKLKGGVTLTGGAGPFECRAEADASFSDFSLESVRSKISCALELSDHSVCVSCAPVLFPELEVSCEIKYGYNMDQSEAFIVIETKKPFSATSEPWGGLRARPLDFLLFKIGFEAKKKG